MYNKISLPRRISAFLYNCCFILKSKIALVICQISSNQSVFFWLKKFAYLIFPIGQDAEVGLV